MSLKPEDIRKIEQLARIAIPEQETERFATDLSGILDFVDQMNAVDTKDVKPMAHPMDQAQRLRDDVVREKDQHETFQKIAPQVEAGLYLVPRVIE